MKNLIAFLCMLLLMQATAQAEIVRAANLSSPLLLSGLAGLKGADDVPEGMRPVLEAELGLGGGKLMLGMDSLGRGLGGGVKISLMQIWLTPIVVDKDQTYLGAELQAGLDRFMGSVGQYLRVAGDDDRWLTTFSLGLRF